MMETIKSILLFVLLTVTVSVYPQDYPDYRKDARFRYVVISKTCCVSDSLTLYEGEIYKRLKPIPGDSVSISVNNSGVSVSRRFLHYNPNLPDSFNIQHMIAHRGDTLYFTNRSSKVLFIVWGGTQQLDSVKSNKSFEAKYPFRIFYRETEPRFIEQGSLDVDREPYAPVVSKEMSSSDSTDIMYYILAILSILIVFFILLNRKFISNLCDLFKNQLCDLKINITEYQQSRKELFNCTVYERDGFVWNPEEPEQNALNIEIVGRGKSKKIKGIGVVTISYRYYTQLIVNDTIVREDHPANDVPFEFKISRDGIYLQASSKKNSILEDKVTFSDRKPTYTYRLEVIQREPGVQVDFTRRHIIEVVVNTSLGTHAEYNYEIFKPSGSVWVGIDPGTTGSTMAIGTDSHNIQLMAYYDNLGNEYNIINSVILFDNKNIIEMHIQDLQPYDHYQFGLDAHNDNAGRYTKFRSIKKWLGYNNHLRVRFGDNYRLFNGVEVAGLLIKGLYHVLETYVERCGEDTRVYRDNNGIFYPDKAVVAVPNNYTIKKIQDMIKAVRACGKFSTVLYVYEAEAVLFYYLRMPGVQAHNSNVLVFDIGGATINASCFHIDVDFNHNYIIDTKGRIGYGIGGDTLDYSIIRILLSMPEIQTAWGLYDPDKDVVKERLRTFECNHNAALVDLAFELKCTIVRNFQNEALIGRQSLSDLIEIFANRAHLKKPEIKNSYSIFERAEDGSYPFFSQPDIQTYVYDNMKDAVSELCKFADVRAIASEQIRVIFSGRTTFFPYIKQCILDALRAEGFKNIGEVCPFDIDQSKTVVAEGCCFYGININKIRLNNNKSLYTYGALVRTDINRSQFIPLIEAGSRFDDGCEHIDSPIKSGYPWGGDGIQFYQVTGYVADANNPSPILSMPKHKYSKFATIAHAYQNVDYQLQMSLHINDTINCSICPTGGQKTEKKGNVISKDIVDENDPHYYFGTIYHSLN